MIRPLPGFHHDATPEEISAGREIAARNAAALGRIVNPNAPHARHAEDCAYLALHPHDGRFDCKCGYGGPDALSPRDRNRVERAQREYPTYTGSFIEDAETGRLVPLHYYTGSDRD